MARKAKLVSVYERINEKKEEIKQAEEVLARLNDELNVLYKEQENEEMKRLIDAMHNQGLDIETALSKLNNKK